jgi:lipopolysaccharide/colanic/teichoic acid biosynthesis glycosyltransferase
MQGSLYVRYGKRIFDFTASLIGLAILSPLLLIIAFLIKLSDRGSVFFKQKRIGQGFRPFSLIKFRTMVINAENIGALITKGGDQRIIRIGRFLRKTKIDEFPQLFNVLKGDMSFVGPRPEVEKYIRLFENDYKDILKVKPGITDYATIEFRDEEQILKKYKNPEDGYTRYILPLKIKLYKKYLKEMSLLTDVKLILLTLRGIMLNVAGR